jgi:uncharacterized protein
METQKQLQKRTALITGASSGIGLELAKVFSEYRYDLVLVARSKDKLLEIKKELEKNKTKVTILVTDLTKPGAPTDIHNVIHKENIFIDVLVNNAGTGTYGLFSKTDVNEEIKMIQLNITSLTHLTKLFLPEMMARKKGKILNVASTAAFVPGPYMAVYYASKAYVLSFSEALAEELKGSGVSVTCLCPGPTRTGFQKTAHIEETGLIKGKEIMNAALVARLAYDGLVAKKRIVIPGLKNKIAAIAPRLMPRKMLTKIVKNIMK